MDKAYEIIQRMGDCDSEILKELVENLFVQFDGVKEYIVENYSEWIEEELD